MKGLQRYGITLIVGKRENGKTTEGVREMVRKIDAGVYQKGYANIHVRHPKVEFVKYEDLHKIREPCVNGVPTAVLYLDQIHKLLDSRQPMCARNKYMNDVAIESRQHGLDWIGTTWAKSSIDLRVRKFSPLVVRAMRMRDRFRYNFIDEEAGRMWYGDLTFRKAEKWWAYFNTAELVEDVPSNWDPRTGPNPDLKNHPESVPKLRITSKSSAQMLVKNL